MATLLPFTHFELASRASLPDAGAMRTALCFVQVAVIFAAASSIAAESQTPPMKAVVLRGYGGPEVAKLEEVRGRSQRMMRS